MEKNVCMCIHAHYLKAASLLHTLHCMLLRKFQLISQETTMFLIEMGKS